MEKTDSGWRLHPSIIMRWMIVVLWQYNGFLNCMDVTLLIYENKWNKIINNKKIKNKYKLRYSTI
jgi:hypothetical protein